MSKIDEIADFFSNMQMGELSKKAASIEMNVNNIKDIEISRIYSKIISAENDIEQSYYEDDSNRKSYIQCIAQCKLNEGITIIQQDFINIIQYFVNWSNINVISKNFGSRMYSEDKIIKNINQLCDDYVYLKKGIILLIRLKQSQGVDKCIIEEREKLKALEDMIYMNEIYNWLPPETEENSWQHQLLYGDKYKQLTTENINFKSRVKDFIINYGKRRGKNKDDMQK